MLTVVSISMTNKTAHFYALIGNNPGITTAELHRRIGKFYAHGHHKFTYDTVRRMLLSGLIEQCSPSEGLNGIGLCVIKRKESE